MRDRTSVKVIYRERDRAQPPCSSALNGIYCAPSRVEGVNFGDAEDPLSSSSRRIVYEQEYRRRYDRDDGRPSAVEVRIMSAGRGAPVPCLPSRQTYIGSSVPSYGVGYGDQYSRGRPQQQPRRSGVQQHAALQEPTSFGRESTLQSPLLDDLYDRLAGQPHKYLLNGDQLKRFYYPYYDPGTGTDDPAKIIYVPDPKWNNDGRKCARCGSAFLVNAVTGNYMEPFEPCRYHPGEVDKTDPFEWRFTCCRSRADRTNDQQNGCCFSVTHVHKKRLFYDDYIPTLRATFIDESAPETPTRKIATDVDTGETEQIETAPESIPEEVEEQVEAIADANVEEQRQEKDGKERERDRPRVLSMGHVNVFTTAGHELAGICIVDETLNPIVETYARPAFPITDYGELGNSPTRIFEYDNGIKKTIRELQRAVLDAVGPNTILVGHNLASPLGQLRIAHPFIVDAMVTPALNPGRSSARQPLRQLVQGVLPNRRIDLFPTAYERAVAALEIVVAGVKDPQNDPEFIAQM